MSCGCPDSYTSFCLRTSEISAAVSRDCDDRGNKRGLMASPIDSSKLMVEKALGWWEILYSYFAAAWILTIIRTMTSSKPIYPRDLERHSGRLVKPRFGEPDRVV
jgi:hypothetical protein